MNAFMKEKQEVIDFFNSNEREGLSELQVKENQRKFGENKLKKYESESLIKQVINAATEPMILMLISAGIIALGVNIIRSLNGGNADFLECLGIFIAISLSVIITVFMEQKSAKAFEALSKINEDTLVKIIRDNEVQVIPQKDIVSGDIVLVETGDKLPVDGRLLEAESLMVDESALTGESMPVSKDSEIIFHEESTPVAERANMLYSGSFVTGGKGKIIVTSVGESTEFGKIANELSSTQKSNTPLQEKLARLGKFITMLGVMAAFIVFSVQIIIFFLSGTISLDTVSEAFITSIVLIVAAVPEGLPTIVAVSLSINIIKMSKQNALVKKMIACETIGCINVICSDKTGTLTENKMKVIDIYVDSHIIKPKELDNKDIIENFCINSTADLELKDKGIKFIGNPTECALLVAVKEAKKDYKEIRNLANILHVFPFSSDTKNMTSIVGKEEEAYVYTKGSPEKIISMCKINEEEKRDIEEEIKKYQKKAYRVIAFAHKALSNINDFQWSRELVESEMIFDGFVAISDPLREDVFVSINKCLSSGIDVKILTGDNLITARAISKELDLLNNNHIAVEAKEIEKLSDDKLEKLLPKIRVIARSTPSIKMRVVKTLKGLGNIVAVTGDGINDAPAIKSADVGIAMGISGTEVSKEASDIVLLNDSFSTIIKAVQWGRGIYENFQRFIQFQLTVNLSSVVVVLFTILLGFKAPFTALQLLWINLIMDGPPALTLGLEPIREDLMGREPTKRNANIVTKGMLRRIVINGVFISLVFLGQHIFNFMGATKEQMPTVLFTLFVVFQLFNAFNSRELTNTSIFKNIANNKVMLIVFIVTFTLQVVITQFGAVFFNTIALPISMWIKIILVGFLVILISEISKLIQRRLSK
ncbi:calcium-translocating P-type ATPase, PMCA-type [Clostridium perfringens]|nr:calcium-translocating P-type ATPase, PMCA-type [Clostridium perfringens]